MDDEVKMNQIILITGASGSGKTTVCKYLAEKYKVYHFDDIGVPSVDEMVARHGSREGWQKWATESWIEKLSKLEGDETIILEGSFNPEFAMVCHPEHAGRRYLFLCHPEPEGRRDPEVNNFLDHYVACAPHDDEMLESYASHNHRKDEFKLICLHSDRKTREKRLVKYRNQPELANQDMENFAKALKEKTIELDGTVIDSSGDIHDTVKACLLAIENKESLRIEVPIEVAKSLIQEQFPQYSYLEIRPVSYSGWDNATYHLGDEMLLRIPRGEAYALKVPKEQALLIKLGKQISTQIPKPIAMGKPAKDYPWNWSIYKYLEGDSANTVQLSDSDLKSIAIALAKFLKELHQIDTKDAPLPGLHNYWRGEHVTVYECGALKYFKELRGIIDTDKALKLWEKAAATKWNNPAVWIHGDLAVGNFLIRRCEEQRDEAVQKNTNKMDCHVEAEASPRKDGFYLSAVIDFGGCAVGDPACDLVVAYTFFKDKSREIFKQELGLDEGTWLRAKAWVLWKAGYELTHIEDKSSAKALEQIRIFKEILDE